MFSDTAIQLQPILAQWVQNTHALAPGIPTPGAIACTNLTWGDDELVAVGRSTAWIGRGISCVCAQGIKAEAHLIIDLTSSQEALRALWCAAYPGVELLGLISEQWKDMGWQGKDPSTDFRGGGFISVENMFFFARNYPTSFQDLLQKQNGERALWEYPFAVAGVNITFMLIQMLDLQLARTLMNVCNDCSQTQVVYCSCLSEVTFRMTLSLVTENDQAFDIMYCITFKLMDHQWLTMHASYMDFNIVMKSTRRRLEQELLLKSVSRIEDLPSYRLLAC
ncbi:hypothetical protein ZIOFF_024471 [Zingiber officinale]|uniref:ELMO domain-containing protein n=1 Tax=Zingiber officinale TaxID=94328 RepID=A0A8J5H0H2_ZINOF|nr:hypothetical protein ZIOFF_024471 [Zingiber officinale]